MIVGIVEEKPCYGIVLSEAESCMEMHNEEDVKHEYTVLEEANKEILLLENLLKEFESDFELEP